MKFISRGSLNNHFVFQFSVFVTYEIDDDDDDEHELVFES